LVVHGARNVARNIIKFWGRQATLVSLPVGSEPCILAFVDRALAALIEFEVKGERIREIHVTARPDSLLTLRAQLALETT
jgi:hypothetical protein